MNMSRNKSRDGYEINGKNTKEFEKEFGERFIKIKSSDSTYIMIDTVTGVQYMMIFPTEYEQGNTTVSVVPIIDNSGFPFVDDRFVRQEPKK